MSVFLRYTSDMKSQTKRRGRPKKSSDQLQNEYLDVRLTASEKKAFKDAADFVGMPLSMWVRDRLRTASRRELEAAGTPVAFLNSHKKDK